ncbi:hypothetical protein C8J56DRAFT_1005980 [Mycena floridula]|nr:hypothetical protein C8J56DRAFT_1005980 [Mycena floridula]
MSVLTKPLQLGPITLKNRIFFSPLTCNRSVPTNVPNDLNREYYKQRSNAGLIVTEATLIVQQGTEWPNAPGIWNKDQIAGWKKITDQVHGRGITHIFGRASHPDMPEQMAAGTPGGKFRQLPGQPGYVTPTAIDDPETLIAQYKQAAINAKEAGFDGVEHGANGFLVHQFLDSTLNLRTDKWGGSIGNRARFGLETLKSLIEVWGADRVAVKLTPAGGYNDMGMPLQETLDTLQYFISEADKLKLSYICIGRHFEMFNPKGRGTPHDVNTKAFFNTGFTPEEAEALIVSGKADGIFFGKL